MITQHFSLSSSFVTKHKGYTVAHAGYRGNKATITKQHFNVLPSAVCRLSARDGLCQRLLQHCKDRVAISKQNFLPDSSSSYMYASLAKHGLWDDPWVVVNIRVTGNTTAHCHSNYCPSDLTYFIIPHALAYLGKAWVPSVLSVEDGDLQRLQVARTQSVVEDFPRARWPGGRKDLR